MKNSQEDHQLCYMYIITQIKCLLVYTRICKRLLQQLTHWNTFKQDNYNTVGGDGECRVGEVRGVEWAWQQGLYFHF